MSTALVSPDRVLPTVARSGDAGRADAALARLHHLYPQLIDLSLGRIEALAAKLGHPERALPPVIHVAGTNGKGSTCANLRAISEAAGWRTHVTVSPHLVNLNERFRIAGRLVDDAELAATLEEIERVNAGGAITVFEVLTATWLLLFARHPAELAIVEVGLGGRYDATNLLERPAACAIAAISMDHEAFLGDTLAKIAGEKAGIIKPGVPVVSGRQAAAVIAVLEAEAAARGAPLLLRDRDWHIGADGDGLLYRDAQGSLRLPLPALPGPHQIDNAGLAVAALRAARGLDAIPQAAWQGLARTDWPARLQRLHGRLAARLPSGWELWLDGGHNPGAAAALAETLDGWRDRPLHLLVGMKQTKNAAGFLDPLLPRAETAWAVAEPDQHLALPVAEIVAASGGVARPGPTVADALARLPSTGTPARLPSTGTPARVLICGSLYLAGEVLKADGTLPR